MFDSSMTDEGPSLDSFLRHLQTEVEAANEIVDKLERNDRLLQLESSIQEAIIFANRYKELQNQGVDPLLLVDRKVQQERPAPPATKGQSILLGSSTCAVCGKLMESDLDFCPSCGAKK
tara:strand:+ start:318 stop:674 length:357 start_codon:yes stop_codon:yes gene_type:complete